MSKHDWPRIDMRGVHCEPLNPKTVARVARGVSKILNGVDQIQREAIKEITKTPSQ